MSITTKDVAKAAGVSLATFFRMMNVLQYVGEQMKDKVLEAIRNWIIDPNRLREVWQLRKPTPSA